MFHLFQLGESCVSAGRDMCLTFFSLVRHVSHLFEFLAQTLLKWFQFVKCVYSFRLHVSFTHCHDEENYCDADHAACKSQ